MKVKKIREKNRKKRLLKNKAPKRRLPHNLRRSLQQRNPQVKNSLYQNQRPSNLLAKSPHKNRFKRSHLSKPTKRKRKRKMLLWKMLLNKSNSSIKKI
jgi:hypothetical protein